MGLLIVSRLSPTPRSVERDRFLFALFLRSSSSSSKSCRNTTTLVSSRSLMITEPARLWLNFEALLTSAVWSLRALISREKLSRAGFPTCCLRVCSATLFSQLQRELWTTTRQGARKQEA